MEFCTLCVDLLWDIPTSTIDLAVENINAARTCRSRRNSTYWKACSESLDFYSRFIVPAVYFLVLGVLFNIDFTDDYAKDPTTLMFSGFGHTVLLDSGVVFVVVYSLAVIFCLSMFFFMKHLAKLKEKKQKEEFLEAGRAAIGALAPTQSNSKMNCTLC